jgi:oxygen-independent coproporphyrinogen III oxidase
MTPDLIARYGRERLPRYTSYPTAPHFSAEVDEAVAASWLAALSRDTELSLYIHVPFCAELCLYCGCHTTVTRRYEPVAAYVDLLLREIDRVAERVTSGLVQHLHWGGGTPTILRASDLRRVARRLEARFDFASAAEIAVEIDPRTITPAHVEALAEVGVNRASLGVQSFEPLVQETIRRRQSFEQTRRVSEWLRFAGIGSLSLDLMVGLPYQTAANVEATVAQALELDPDRLSLFGYAHVPWMKRHQALLPEEALPDGPERAAQFEAAARRIEAAGYVRVGLDHFAKPDDPLAVALRGGALKRNFQGYTTDSARALIGLGASAISRLPQGYAQNAAAVPDYRAAIEAGRLATMRGLALTPEDRLRGEIIERLMCDLAVDLDAVCERHAVGLDHFASEFGRLGELERDGIAFRRGARIEVAEGARDLVRVVGSIFDHRLADGTGRHAPAL